MSFEAMVIALGALNAAGLFGLVAAAWRWVHRVERRLMRLEAATWPESLHPTR